ncbi:MAG: amino acid permease [Syntrophorhabdaceae bacterium]
MKLFDDLLRKKIVSFDLCDPEHSNDNGRGISGKTGLVRVLGVKDLMAMGIAAIIGAGIFSAIGNAAYWGGPAIIFLFIFTAFACGCTAMCYAQFASFIPVSGSAYTYAYVVFGEFIAWIIGWTLLMEYAIGNIAVAISWSNYLVEMLAGYGLKVPDFLAMDYRTAACGAKMVENHIASGWTLDMPSAMPALGATLRAYTAWVGAPTLLGHRIIFNLPAIAIVIMITALIYIGIQESKRVSNIMVIIKIMTVILVIVAGAFYVRPANWAPFAPNGLEGVMKGVSGIFFAYIGFDALSTTAEECRDPQRDLPRAMFGALGICTVLYVALVLVLTGMVHYTKLQVGDPLAFAFGKLGANVEWLMGIIAASAVVAMSSVLLVFMLGQPRIWMAMSRDGLLPSALSLIHRRYKTPWLATIVTGFCVAIPSLFMNLNEVTDLTSIGTLFAFSIVCAGTLIFDTKQSTHRGKFRVPYIDSRYIFAPALLCLGIAVLIFTPQKLQLVQPGYCILGLKWAMIFFMVFSVILCYFSFARRLSLIPLIGLESCMYLMTELTMTCWLRFAVWMSLGLFIYFFYSRSKSKLCPSNINA